LLAHGRWFSPGTLASSTTKTGRHDIAEMLLKVALNTKNGVIVFICNIIMCLMSNQPIIFSISQVVDAANITR
jgi:hypothetical protein